MLSGNPDEFAIWFDPVDSWSTDRFKNGCLGYFIGGKLILSSNSTIGVDIHGLSLLRSMHQSVEDEGIFNLPPEVAYEQLCSRSFPSMDSGAEVNDFRYLVSAESLSDDGYYVFLVEFGEQAKLIVGFKDDFGGVRQVVLRRGEFQDVVRDAIGKFDK